MEFVTEHARCGDEAALAGIWNICFDDGGAYSSEFMRTLFDPRLTVTVRADGKIVGAAYLIPTVCGGVKLLYIYAVGVLPEYRGRGIGEALIGFSKSFAEKENRLCFLSPDDEGLAAYYARLGFEGSFSVKISQFGAPFVGGEKKRIEELSTAAYEDKRRKFFGSAPFVEWEGGKLEYARFAGDLTFAEFNGISLAFNVKKRFLTVREILCEDAEAARIMPLFIGFLGCSAANLTMPISSSLGSPAATGMTAGGTVNGYFNLTMN